tara:strand:- start:891 stop:1130 length:240 start_codon:yes stop_codon:yes gene_type:complete
MSAKVHSKPIDTPETTVVAAALVACVLHLAGLVELDQVNLGVAIGACLTPVAMFAVRIVTAAASRVEEAVVPEEEGEES